ncbi:MAG: phosphoenolpyruvate carboxykinase (ATP) [Balneolaceae bacterium]
MTVDYNKHPRSTTGLDYLGIQENKNILWNLNPSELYEQAILNKEAVLTKDYALRVLTGEYTGRSPDDKFFVEENSVKDDINWGKFNQPVSEEVFEHLYHKMIAYLQDQRLYVKDLYAGADPDYRLNVRVVSEAAYHGLFAHNMFIRPDTEELRDFDPQFTVLAAPRFKADPETDGTRSGTFIFCSFDKKLILIGGTLYSGEVKKGIFSVLNYLLPKKGVLAMHCSANKDSKGNTAIFFGLSGTGKTTLSSDTDRILIGDDEHGWSDDGIFNFEGGCYAKTIDLSQDNEPLIYNTTRMAGTILENVILDEERNPDFGDDTLTQNIRCSYPLHYIPNASAEGTATHPTNIIFLTCDAFGVLPPISRLTPEQSMYHFISGYTAKVAGTERGITEPQATFSACFGAPFMPLAPTVYAELLAEKIKIHNTKVWLVNTGWTGGPYGTGSRIQLTYTRQMLSEALSGNLDDIYYQEEPVFGLNIPAEVSGVPAEILRPRETWKDKAAYDAKAQELAEMFSANFRSFKKTASSELLAAGPVI